MEVSASPRLGTPQQHHNYSPRVTDGRKMTDLSPMPSPRLDWKDSAGVVPLAPLEESVVGKETGAAKKTDEGGELKQDTTSNLGVHSVEVADHPITSSPQPMADTKVATPSLLPRPTEMSQLANQTEAPIQQHQLENLDDRNIVASTVVRDTLNDAVERVATKAISDNESSVPISSEDTSQHVTFSATAPPVYHGSLPEAESSRVTECDAMSDYQSFVKDEDLPPIQRGLSNDDVVMPSASMVSQSESSAMVDASMVAEYDTSDYQGELKEDDVIVSDDVDEPQPRNSLPFGWVEGVDEASGAVYYYNTITDESSWTIPINETMNENAQQLGPSEDNNAEFESKNPEAAFEPANSSAVGLPQQSITSEAVPSEEPPFFDGSNALQSLTPTDEAGQEIQHEVVSSEELPFSDGSTIHQSLNATDDAVQEIEHAPEQSPGLANDDAIGNEQELPVPAVSEEMLPAGWVEGFDESSGRVYYYNEMSGESLWEKPSLNLGNAETCLDSLTDPLSDANGESHVDLAPVEMASEAVTECVNELLVEHDGLDKAAQDDGDVSGRAANLPEAHVEENVSAEDVPPQEQCVAPLPDGWFEAKDPSGAAFYVCQATGESTWERPGIPVTNILEPIPHANIMLGSVDTNVDDDFAPDEVLPDDNRTSEEVVHEETQKKNSDASASDLSSSHLPSGWTEIIDPQSGQKYFYNDMTDQTCWEMPHEQVEPDADLSTGVEGVPAYESTAETDEICLPQKNQDPAIDNNFEDSSAFQESETVPIDAVAGSIGEENETPLSLEDHVAIAENPASLSEGWQEATDPATGKTYFFNELTGETSWECPGIRKNLATETDKIAEQEIDENLPETPQQEETTSPRIERDVPVDKSVDALSLETKDVDETRVSGGSENGQGENAKLSSDEVDTATLEVSKPFPTCWQTAADPTSGKTYYYNELTGETSWTYPEIEKEVNSTTDKEITVSSLPTPQEHKIESGAENIVSPSNEAVPEFSTAEPTCVEPHEEVGENSPSDGKTLPAGWVASEDPASGKVFYYNNETGDSQWEPPHSDPTAFEQKIVEHSADDSATKAVELEVNPTASEEAKRSSLVLPDIQNVHSDVSVGSAVTGNKVENITPTSTLKSSPAGWQAAVDPTSGKSYYYNEETGETAWELPGDAKSTTTAVDNDVTPSSANIDGADKNTKDVPLPEESSIDAGKPLEDLNKSEVKLPSGWLSAIDEASGKIYYYNDELGETSWEPPMKNVANEVTDANSKRPTSATSSSERSGDRRRPAHALAAFGFGGRLCVMIPQVAKSLSGAALPSSNDVPKTMRRGPIVIHQLRNLIPHDHKYSVPAHLSRPMIKSRDQDITAFLDKKCADTDSLIWKVVHIAAQNGGRLKDDFGAVVDLLLSAEGKESNGEFEKRCSLPQSSKIPVSSFVNTDLEEIQSKLVSFISSCIIILSATI